MLGYGHDDKGVWHSPHFAWGVYLDDNTGGVDVVGNIVARCSRATLHLHNARDHNLVWNGGGKLVVGQLAVKAGEPAAMDEWDAWRELGQDRHSLVADPMFVDPANDDFRLQPGSPAFQLGFKAIPVDRIGLYQDGLRASWPIREAEGAREKPLVRAQ